MKHQIDSVAEFHKVFDNTDKDSPGLINPDTYQLRYNLMLEEVDEYYQACYDNDLPGIADALGDQLYILCGTILKHGLQHKIEEVFNEIHASNMSKLGEDGKPIYREDGKVLKGPGYFKPNITAVLYGKDC